MGTGGVSFISLKVDYVSGGLEQLDRAWEGRLRNWGASMAGRKQREEHDMTLGCLSECPSGR